MQKKEDYNKTVKQVWESGKFIFFPNKKRTTLTVLKGQIEVDIVEMKDCVSLGVWLIGRNDNTGFSGLTDMKGIGFSNFLLSYKQNPSILISLKCKNKETLVLGIKNVNLELFNEK